MGRSLHYRYFIDTYGAPSGADAPHDHIRARIGYFATGDPLGQAEARWIADMLSRLFASPSRTVSVFPGWVDLTQQDPVGRAVLTDRLHSIAVALVEGERPGYRFLADRLDWRILSELYDHGCNPFVLLTPGPCIQSSIWCGRRADEILATIHRKNRPRHLAEARG